MLGKTTAFALLLASLKS